MKALTERFPVSHIRDLAARRDGEEGFTLIELMVVVLIIAILIAIAIPTFLGARKRANDRAAQSDLRNGLATEETIYTDNQVYSADTAAGGVLKTAESSLQWGVKLNVVVHATPAAFCLSEQSASGTWFALDKIATGGDAGVYYTKDPAANPCPADPSTVGPSGLKWATVPNGAAGGW